MNHLMFMHLLQEFSLNFGNNLPENFQAVKDALGNVAFAVQEQQNLNEADFAKKRESTKQAFKKLKEACDTLLKTDRSALQSEAYNKLYTHISCIQAPLNCYINDLENGMTLKAALEDSAWMEGLFNDDNAVKDRNDYVPGRYNIQDKQSFKEILDTYIEESDRVKANFNQHLKTISGSPDDPSEAIQYKLQLLQDYCDAYPITGRKAEFTGKIGNAYKVMEMRMDRSNMENYHDHESMMGDVFFGEAADILYQRVSFEGAIEAMKILPKEAIQRMLDETKKLRFKPAKMGVTQEQIERLEVLSSHIQAMKASVESLRVDYQDLDTNPLTGDILQEADSLFDSVQEYLKGTEGVQLPAREEWAQFAVHLKGRLDEIAMFNSDNKEFNDVYKTFYSVYQGLQKSVLELKNELSTEMENLQDEMIGEYLEQQEMLSSVKLDSDQKQTVADGIKDVYASGIISRETLFDTLYIRMARDPEYNQAMIQKCRDVMNRLVKENSTKHLSLEDYPFGGNNLATGETHTVEELYAEAATMLLVGTKLAKDRPAIEAAKGGRITELEKLKNTPEPRMADVVNAKKLTAKHLKEMHTVIAELKNAKVYKRFLNSDKETAMKIVNSKEYTEEMVKAFSSDRINFLYGVSDQTLSALVQTSGNAYASNSKSYNDMSNALKNIYKKNSGANPANIDDYKALYNACKEYSLSHDSHPFTDNGKLRANAAVKMMHTLGETLSKVDPEFAKTAAADRAVNMARFKSYRDAVKKGAMDKLWDTISNNLEQIGKNYSNLSADVKQSIERYVQMIGNAECLDHQLANESGSEIRGKVNTEQIRNNLGNQVRDAMTTTEQKLEEFRQDPVIFLAKFDNSLSKQAFMHNGPDLK